MRKQAGFTLIELIAVIVILAILAVVAVPQYVDLRADAANAAAAGVGGAVASGSALNYARGVASGTSAVVITSCTNEAQLAGVLSSGGATLPRSGGITGYTLGGSTNVASGATGSCTIRANGPTGTAAQSFTIIGCATAGGC